MMFRKPMTGLAAVGCVVGAAAIMPAAAQADSAETATGVVFHDANRNGDKDAGEQGVPGVRVSNGSHVVVTDADGSYELAVEAGTTIFVTKPSGWMVPVNEHMLPQFYYHHFPNGSPYELRYGGLEPTGPLPESIDFPLTRQDESARFSPLVFADPQTRNVEEVADLKADVLDELKGTTAPFGLTVGDIVNNPLDLFPVHNEAVAELGIPWWNLPGNHDMDFDAPTDANATDTYKQVFGPTNYSFDHGDVHVIALDNVEKLGATRQYRGYLNDQQLRWIENDLAHVPHDKLVVIATHIPLRNPANPGAPGGNTARLSELLDLLEDRKHVYSIAGHRTHNSWQVYLGPGDGWNGDEPLLHQILAEVRGSGWTTGPFDERGVQQADQADGNPNGYYSITFDGNDFAPQYKPASLPGDFLMRISFRSGDQLHVPGGPSGSGDFGEPVTWHRRDFAAAEDRPVVEVNVFDGGERNVVQMSIDGGEFMPMTHSEPTHDPYITELFRHYQGTPQAPAAPVPSSHIWTQPLPRNLAPGQHEVTVRSTSAWGQVAERSSAFTVAAGRPAN